MCVRVCISRYCLQVKAAGHDRHWNGLPWTGAQHIYYSGGEPARTLDALALRRSRRGPVAARRVLRSKSFARYCYKGSRSLDYSETDRFGGEAECEWREAWAGGRPVRPAGSPTCVRPLMYIEAGLLREALQTRVALIGPLACMRAHVNVQVGATGERRRALPARERTPLHCAQCTHKSE